MTLHERAQAMTTEEVVDLLQEKERIQQQLDWFKSQLFGPKSERRIVAADGATQLSLGEQAQVAAAFAATAAETSIEVPAHRRRKHSRSESAVTDEGLRFDASVPIEVVTIADPRIDALPPDAYEVIAERATHHLAQKPGAYVVIKQVRQVVRLKETREIVCPPAPVAVLERSYADVSVLAGLVVDKFVYHLPLHRQHQRMRDGGIQIDRSTLTQWVHRTAQLLEPVRQALLQSILQSKVLAMDETPIRAGRAGPTKGHTEGHTKSKMRQGYLWPAYGDRDEVVFHFERTRAGTAVPKLLEGFRGTLISDGYDAYARYADKADDVTHAQCWVHARRKFVQAETVEPELCSVILQKIADLYRIEEQAREASLDTAARLQLRRNMSSPIVAELFQTLRTALDERVLLPSSPFTKAAHYALQRERALRVFLDDGDVPLDTNHLEREIRPVAVGRKNWMFCWTETGAEVVATLHSVIGSCRLQQIDPYTYLVDVLQRIGTHPAKDVEALIPRRWKDEFGHAPRRSVIDRRG
jgi:transposase